MANRLSRPILTILKPGILTTVQDLGIHGYKWLGIAESGAMDTLSMVVANRLLGNNDNAAVLEITHTGPTVAFLEETWFSLSGADLDARLDGEHLGPGNRFRVGKGATLTFGACQYGLRAYLAVWGGLDVPPIMNSRSTFVYGGFGGLAGRPLQPGDQIAAFVPAAPRPPEVPLLPEAFKVPDQPPDTLRVVLGPHTERFSSRGLETFLSASYEISHEANRMGYRLHGPRIEHAGSPIVVSTATALGTIQVPGSGIPVILLRERGTTGGYTQIACITSVDLDRLAQCFAGDRISFCAIKLPEAHTLEAARQAALDAWQPPSDETF